MSDSHQLDEIAAYNDRSLKTLERASAKSRGRFSLILVRCNYVCLRSQMLQLLRERCSLNIQELTLKPSAETLYTTILEQFGTQPPDAVMVLGLESVVALDELLAATNKVRDQFSGFAFPVVLWVTDEVFKRLVRVAPDFKNWASPPIEFTLPNNELMALLRENAEQAFADEPTFSLDAAELKAVQQDLQSQGEELDPELKASLAFIWGLIHARNQQFDEAIHQYQHSLEYWQQNRQVERCCIVLFHIALAHYLKGKEYWEETRHYIRQCLERFEQANHADLLAKQIYKWGELLRQLEAWEELQQLAEKALALHQSQGEPKQVAQDYVFLAEVALKKSHWKEANQQAQQALEILEKIPDVESQILGLCYFILAKSQRQLGQIKNAISNLEKARQVGAWHAVPLHQYDPRLYVRILEELRTIKFEQGDYLDAFHLKLEQRKIESQYGLRAFIGAGRLQPPREAINPVAEGVGVRREVSIEQIVAASGRQRDVEELIERVKRRDRKLTVIYGPSGVGKSSIVQAALVPALQRTYFEGRDFLPVLVQVYKDWVGTLGECLAKALGFDLAPFSLDSEVRRGINSLAGEQSDAKPQLNLQSILEQLRQNEHRHLLTVLIFDQFEEFFFDNKDQVSRQEFYDFLRQCLEIPYLKFILSLREDYIYYLLELSRTTELTNIDKDYEQILYYLGKFSAADAKAVIQRLTARSHSPLESDLVEQLVKDLAGKWEKVRPIELQVVGTQLETEKITTLKHYQELGTKPEKKLVERFLEDVVKDCGKENERAAQLVLYLLTNENNTRPLKTQAELREDLDTEAKKLDLVLEILEGSGLVFCVPGVPDDRYQLVHDYLVSFIRQKYQPQSLELELTKQQLKEALRQAQQQSVIAQCNASKAFFLLDQKFEALVAALKAGKQVKKANLRQTNVESKAVNALADAVYNLREYNSLEGHSHEVNRVSFSPDGEMIASTSWDKTVKLWKRDGALLSTLTGHSDRVISVSFSPDGETIASASGDKTVKLWKKDGTLLTTLTEYINGVNSISFSPDGQMIVSASGVDNTVKLWKKDGTLLTTLTGHDQGVISLSFSPDGQMIASASADETVKLWKRDGTLLTTLTGHSATVTSVSFSPDGEIIASASWDKTVKLWKKDGTLLTTLTGHKDMVISVSFSPDGQTIASASWDKTVKLWQKDGRPFTTLIGHKHGVYSVSFSPDGQTIASASRDKTVKLWKKDSTSFTILTEHIDGVISVSFSPDGQTIASASADKTVKLWKRDGTLLTTLTGHKEMVISVSFSPDGQTIASASLDNTVKLWKKDGTLIATLTGHRAMFIAGVYSVSFSPDGQTLVTGSVDATVKLWKKDGTLLTTLAEHGDGIFAEVYSVSFSPDGRTIASASQDKTVKLWQKDGALVTTLSGHNHGVRSVSFSPDGQTLASASLDKTVKLWKKDGTLITTLTGHKDGVYSVTFSPDGQTLASASADNTVKLWKKDGTLITTLNGHKDEVYSVSFSPDGQTLATASQDKTVKLWNINLDDLLDDLLVRGCDLLHDYLKTNPNVEENDRTLCDGIDTQK